MYLAIAQTMPKIKILNVGAYWHDSCYYPFENDYHYGVENYYHYENENHYQLS